MNPLLLCVGNVIKNKTIDNQKNNSLAIQASVLACHKGEGELFHYKCSEELGEVRILEIPRVEHRN